jgi:hypothetical protein
LSPVYRTPEGEATAILTGVETPTAPPEELLTGGAAGESAPEPGKGSKWNSVNHGMTSKTLFPHDLAAAIAQWTADLTALYCPTTTIETILIADMARGAAQMDHAQKLKVLDLERCMQRATLCWDDDRCVYINDLAERLPTDCERVARALN